MPFDINTESEFIQACADNNIPVVETLLKDTPTLVNTPASNGSYPLMFAYEKARRQLLHYKIVNRKANVQSLDENSSHDSEDDLENAALKLELAFQAGSKMEPTLLSRMLIQSILGKSVSQFGLIKPPATRNQALKRTLRFFREDRSPKSVRI